MKNIIYLLLLVLLITNCKKDEKPEIKQLDYIISGDSITTKFVKLNYNLNNYTKSDSVPSNNNYGSFGFEDIPLDIDNDSIKDIRYGCGYLINNDFLVFKSFLIRNNYGNEKNIEFCVQDKDYYGGSTDTLNPTKIILVSTFSKFDTINEHHRWIYDNNGNDAYYISYYSNLQKYFNNSYSKDLLYNGNVQDKYIGIRKRINDKYIYGWIKFSISNYDKLEIKGCAFAY